jgi:hypothetical protein
MSRQLAITSIIKQLVSNTGWNADSYFIDAMASSKRYKFWSISPRDQDLIDINQSFKELGINAQAKRITKGKWVKEECLGIFVGNDHAKLPKDKLDALRMG